MDIKRIIIVELFDFQELFFLSKLMLYKGISFMI
jgi:hypothetical protein